MRLGRGGGSSDTPKTSSGAGATIQSRLRHLASSKGPEESVVLSEPRKTPRLHGTDGGCRPEGSPGTETEFRMLHSLPPQTAGGLRKEKVKKTGRGSGGGVRTPAWRGAPPAPGGGERSFRPPGVRGPALRDVRPQRHPLCEAAAHRCAGHTPDYGTGWPGHPAPSAAGGLASFFRVHRDEQAEVD